MKEKKMFGMNTASLLLLALVFAFAFTSCDDGGSDKGGGKTGLDGTWTSTYGEIITISGSSFTYYDGSHSYVKGTFSLDQRNSTITLNYSQYSSDGRNWYNGERTTDYGWYSVDGNTLYLGCYYVEGTFYKSGGNTRDWTPTYSYTTLSSGVWSSNSMPSSGTREQWYRFTANASLQYIHVSFGGLTDLYVQLYNNSGTTIGENSNLYGSTRYTYRSLTSGQTYYIKVTPYSTGYGSYQIAFNASSTPPGGTPGTSVPGTPYNVTASAQSSSSIRITWSAPTSGGTPSYYNIYRATSYNGTYSYIDYTTSTSYTDSGLSSSTTYYYKVAAYNSAGTGPQSAYDSATTSGGGGTWTPSYSYSTMYNSGQWYSGSISSSSGQQWFRFTATASTQYIHVYFGGLTDLYVQVYDSWGYTVGTEVNLYGGTTYISRSLTSGMPYYIKVRPYGSNYGSYEIAFNTSSSRPYR